MTKNPLQVVQFGVQAAILPNIEVITRKPLCQAYAEAIASTLRYSTSLSLLQTSNFLSTYYRLVQLQFQPYCLISCIIPDLSMRVCRAAWSSTLSTPVLLLLCCNLAQGLSKTRALNRSHD